MTPRQMYSELAKIAGHVCGDNKIFLASKRPTMAHVEVIQRRILCLLEKIDYDRTFADFRRVYADGVMPRPRPEIDEESMPTRRTGARLSQNVQAMRYRDPVSVPFPTSPQDPVPSMETMLREARADMMRDGLSAVYTGWNTEGTVDPGFRERLFGTVDPTAPDHNADGDPR